jgi:hypothetical protein
VKGKETEHVVKKAAARVNIAPAVTVKVYHKPNVGLGGFPCD